MASTTDQTHASDDSTLLRAIIDDFLERVSKDDVIPPHIGTALKTHFSGKTSISAPEARAILTSPPEVT